MTCPTLAICYQVCFSHFLPPGCTVAPLSASLSGSNRSPLSSLMTANTADRQIYLHWWREGRREEKVISRGLSDQPRRLGKAGLAANSGFMAPPHTGHISLCAVPGPQSSQLDGTKAWPDSYGPTSASRGIESRRPEDSHRLMTEIPQSQWFIFPSITLTIEPLMRQAAASHRHPEPTGRVKGRASNRMTSFRVS